MVLQVMEVLSLEQLQEGFSLLLEHANPSARNDFLIWLELKLTELKYQGYIRACEVSADLYQNVFLKSFLSGTLAKFSKFDQERDAVNRSQSNTSTPTSATQSTAPLISSKETNQNGTPSHEVNLSPNLPGLMPPNLLMAQKLFSEYSSRSCGTTPSPHSPYLDPILYQTYFSPHGNREATRTNNSPSKLPPKKSGTPASVRVNLSEQFGKELQDKLMQHSSTINDQKVEDQPPNGKLPDSSPKTIACDKCHGSFKSNEQLAGHNCKVKSSFGQTINGINKKWNQVAKSDSNSETQPCYGQQFSPISQCSVDSDGAADVSSGSGGENITPPPSNSSESRRKSFHPKKAILLEHARALKEAKALEQSFAADKAVDMSIHSKADKEKGLSHDDDLKNGLENFSKKIPRAQSLLNVDRMRSYSDSEISPSPGYHQRTTFLDSPLTKYNRQKPSANGSPSPGFSSSAQKRLNFLPTEGNGVNFLATETGTYHISHADLDSGSEDGTGSVGPASVGNTPTKCIKVVKQGNYLKLKKEAHLVDGELRFICPHCSKIFHRSSNFSRHMRIHRGVFSYICSTCQRGFYRKEHFDKHKCYRKSMATTWDRKTKVDMDKAQDDGGRNEDGQEMELDEHEDFENGIPIDVDENFEKTEKLETDADGEKNDIITCPSNIVEPQRSQLIANCAESNEKNLPH